MARLRRKVRLIVECEDALHRSFATRFLDRVSVSSDKKPEIVIRDGKARVLDALPARIQTVRKAAPEAHLVVLIDGDDWEPAKIKDLIDERLLAADQAPLRLEDRVLLIVPRWQMDTWIRHLRGEPVTETKTGATELSHNSEARKPAQDLAEHCRNHRPLTNPLPSLEAACREWNAYRERHGL